MPRRSGARSAISSTRTPPRSVYAKGLASPELRLPLLREGPHALPHVLALRDQRLRERLLLEAGLEPALVGALEKALRHAERERRAACEPLAPLARRRLESRARHDPVAEPDAERLVGGEVVGEQDELLRLQEAHQAREEERAPRVDGEAAAGGEPDEAPLRRPDDAGAGPGGGGAPPRPRAPGGGPD